MSDYDKKTYGDILDIVWQWEAERRWAFLRDVMRRLPSLPESRRVPRDTLSRALGIAAAGTPPPSDEEVDHWLDEHRTEKYR